VNAPRGDDTGQVNGIQHLAGGLPVNSGSDSQQFNGPREINLCLCRGTGSMVLWRWPQGPEPARDRGCSCSAGRVPLAAAAWLLQGTASPELGSPTPEHLCAHLDESLKYRSTILLSTAS